MPSALRLAVARARALAGLLPRRRGAQFGNQNWLTHGRYSRRFLLRCAHTRGLLRQTRVLITEMFALARRNMVTKRHPFSQEVTVRMPWSMRI